MGFIVEPTPEMGEYTVEVRRESFYLSGQSNAVWQNPGTGEISDESARPGPEWQFAYVKREHGIFVYLAPDSRQGMAEILIEDIPKIRACLDVVEDYATRHPSR